MNMFADNARIQETIKLLEYIHELQMEFNAQKCQGGRGGGGRGAGVRSKHNSPNHVIWEVENLTSASSQRAMATAG